MGKIDDDLIILISEYYGCFGYPFAPENKIIERLGISEKLDVFHLELVKMQLSQHLTDLVAGPWEQVLLDHKIVN